MRDEEERGGGRAGRGPAQVPAMTLAETVSVHCTSGMLAARMSWYAWGRAHPKLCEKTCKPGLYVYEVAAASRYVYVRYVYVRSGAAHQGSRTRGV